jgi:hypothetical protein
MRFSFNKYIFSNRKHVVWKSSIGENTLGNKMKELSELTQIIVWGLPLSPCWTEMDLRHATLCLSQNTNQKSIRSYSKTDGTKMQAMSKVLSNIITQILVMVSSNMCIARRNCYTLLKVSQWLWDEELQWKQLFLCLDFQISS